MAERLKGPLLVAIAALMWGTDSLLRFPTSAAVDPTYIVFCEHVVGIVLLVPWMWLRYRGELFNLGAKGWLSCLTVGAGGGAFATVLFTASFRYLNPSVAVLLQKLQPVFVVILAFVFLGERPRRGFYLWAAMALASGFVLSFPDLDVSFLRESGNVRAKGVIYSLVAAAIWGVSTVAGRSLLLRAPSPVATFWRYAFGLLTLSAILYAAGIPVSWEAISSREVLVSLTYLSIVTGLVPILVYYAGMARTPANVTTFIELLYPISAVALNTAILGTALSPMQLGAGAALLVSVTMLSARGE